MERSFLRRMSVTIIIFHSSHEMHEKAKEHEPNVIVIDTLTTGIDCFGCCEKLKADPETRSIPVLIVASAGEEDRCVRAECDGVVIRPMTEESFCNALSPFMKVGERAKQRIPIVKKIKCSLHGVSESDLYSKDLSTSGIFLKSRKPLPIGSILDMEILLAGKSLQRIHVSGEVVRSVEYQKDSHLIAGMGIRFKNVEEDEKIRLQSLFGRIPSQGRGYP